jgi:hypothetical protein
MKTGALKYSQQIKQRVYNISCDCGRWYIGKNFQKYVLRSINITWPRVCLKNQNYPNMHTKEATKYVGKGQKSSRLNRTPHTRNMMNL